MPVWWKTASLNWGKRHRQWPGANCGACWGNTLSTKGANFGHEGFPMGFVAIESPWLLVMYCCCIERKTLIFYLSMYRRCHTQNKRRCAAQAASQAAEQNPTEESQDLRASQAAEVHHWPLNNYCWAISDVLLSLLFFVLSCVLTFLVQWPDRNTTSPILVTCNRCCNTMEQTKEKRPDDMNLRLLDGVHADEPAGK